MRFSWEQQHALASPPPPQNYSTQCTPSFGPDPFNPTKSDPLIPQNPGPCSTQIEDGPRYLEYGRIHGVSGENRASLELKKLPAGAVAITSVVVLLDKHIHLKESAQSYSDEQQAQTVVGPVLDEPPRRMSVVERARRYEAKTVSNITSVGHCTPTHIQACRSVPTAATIPTKIPQVYPTVVTPAAAVTTPILSDASEPVEKTFAPTVVTPVEPSSFTAETTTNELPSSSILKTSAGKMPFADIVTGLAMELISRGDSERSANGVQIRDPLQELIMELIRTDTPNPSMGGSPSKDPIYGLIVELISIETKTQSKGKSTYKSTLYKLHKQLMEGALIC
ncbi:hypothetical protein BASA83_000444 [Batrachochytrium salamandrivorans]|nr:hypothetical protein BASA83_000444 [Batrachochytrium salamandrivorans]